jgi:competence protein ComEC
VLSGDDRAPFKDRTAGDRQQNLTPDRNRSHFERLLRLAEHTPHTQTSWPNGKSSSRGAVKVPEGRSSGTGRELVWITFAFATGVSAYFLLPEEPAFPAVCAGFLACLIASVLFRRKLAVSPLAMLGLAVVSGFFVANLRTEMVEAPRLLKERTATVAGFVSDRVVNTRGVRLVIDLACSGGEQMCSGPSANLQRVRIRVPGQTDARIGDAVRIRARLFPPAGPVRPDGYDFSFRAFYEQIGATGFSYGPPEQIDLGPTPTTLKAKRWLQDIRDGIANRIRDLLGEGEATELAAALLVGDRSGISEESEDVLRQAGLAHILAISGLHMALFAGGAFTVFLMVLSLSETAALNLPTHRIAAVAALAAAVVYLGLSGASVATQRSFVMVSLVFLAVLTGRQGLTLRSVAVAALALLAIAPERLFHPGFQMSFAAVLCLVAVYETWRTRQAVDLKVREPLSGFERIVRSLFGWIVGLLVTALVAGTATGLIGAYHFGRIAPYGVVGNLLGIPLFSLLVMPMGVLALVLMPLGLAAYPLQVMAYGLDGILVVAEWTAAIDAGDGTIPSVPASSALLAVTGLFALVLFTGRRRLAGLALLGVAGGILMLARPPDVLIPEKGKLVAARDVSHRMRFHATRAGFAVENWLRLEGISPEAFHLHRMGDRQRTCDHQGCVLKAYPPAGTARMEAGLLNPILIALPTHPAALMNDCRYADVIVTALDVPSDCKADLIIDGQARADLGSLALWLDTETPSHDRVGPEDSTTAATTYVSAWKPSKTSPPRPWHR